MGLKSVVDTLDDVDEKFHELYTQKGDKYELTGIEGVRTQADVDRLQSALSKERNDHKQVRERLQLLGDRKIEDVLSQLDRIPELEAAAKGKLDEAQIEQIVEGRLRVKVAPLEREKSQLTKQIEMLTTENTTYKGKERTRSIHDAVRGALTKQQGFQPSAVDDALIYAERMLDISDDGQIVTRDGVGVTPGVDAAVWLSEMQSKRPHWWGPSQGGGAGGNRSGNGGGSNPWTAASWNMTEQGRVLRENPQRAEQLAKSAGTTIGGPRPQPQK